MKDLLRGFVKLMCILTAAAILVILIAWLTSVKVLSAKIGAVLIFSLPLFWCIGKIVVCCYLMKRGLPATGYFSTATRTAHLRYCSADGIERKGSCDLLTRRILKTGRTVDVWYAPKHPTRFTTGMREVIVHLFFSALFLILPIFLLIRL